MQIEMKKNPYQKHWWDGEVVRLVMYISRNDIVWIGIGVVIAALYFWFLPSLDFIFGLRS